jgi:hypothetical protein
MIITHLQHVWRSVQHKVIQGRVDLGLLSPATVTSVRLLLQATANFIGTAAPIEVFIGSILQFTCNNHRV